MGVLGEYYKHRRLMLPLAERVDEMEAEIERLRAIIEKAPHDPFCNRGIGDLCDCWKAALRGEVSTGEVK